jgi:DNA polymerase-3 subunit epsilon
MEAHGISCARRHRAYDDAQVLLEFLASVERDQGHEVLGSAIDRALKSHTLPARLSREDLRAIPNSTGVYTFYGQDDEVLYVGKSVTLRTRVLSHFSGDHASGKELRMCQETARVEYKETSGELSALFLESKMVKDLSPTYNRALRRHKRLALVVARAGAQGYTEASVEYREEISPEEFGAILAVCRTKAQARAFLRTVAKEHGLCGKLLGLEKGPGACFGRQIEACLGACTGHEAPGAYNKRLARVFARYRIKSWPFSGAIVIRDEAQEGEGTAYVVDQWCLKEVIEYSHGSHSATPAESVFDLDSYKILARFLLDKKKSQGLVSPYAGLEQGYEPVVE